MLLPFRVRLPLQSGTGTADDAKALSATRTKGTEQKKYLFRSPPSASQLRKSSSRFAEHVREKTGPQPATAAARTVRNKLRPAEHTYLRTLTISFFTRPSPTIGACASSGMKIVNCPGLSV